MPFLYYVHSEDKMIQGTIPLSDFDVIIAILAGTIAFLMQFGGIIWYLRGAVAKILDKISLVEHSADLDIQKLRNEILNLKLQIADEYIKKDTFKTVTNDLKAYLVRLEGKLDAMIAGCVSINRK